MKEIEERVNAGDRFIALDLKGNRFVSLPVIKFCVEIATRLGKQGGSLALVGCIERTKRHFEIYGTLDEIRICQNTKELSNPLR